MNDDFGDENFKDFIDGDESENHKHGCPKINEMLFIVSTIREKMKFIEGLYKESLMRYEKLTPEDPMKQKLREYITDLMTQSTRAMDQLDYALIDNSDPGPGDEDGPPKDVL